MTSFKQLHQLYLFSQLPKSLIKLGLGKFVKRLLRERGKETITISISSACRNGYYKPANESGGCRLCPPNSRTHGEGSERCDCLQGFNRLEMDPDDIGCTSKKHLVGLNENKQLSSYHRTCVWNQTLKVYLSLLEYFNSKANRRKGRTHISKLKKNNMLYSAIMDMMQLDSIFHDKLIDDTGWLPSCFTYFYFYQILFIDIYKIIFLQLGFFCCFPVLSPTEPPSAPVNLTAHHHHDSVLIVTWDPPQDWGGRQEVMYGAKCEKEAETGKYEACEDDVVILPDSVGLTETSVKITGLNPQCNYRLTVQAWNDLFTLQGTPPSSSATVNIHRCMYG